MQIKYKSYKKANVQINFQVEDWPYINKSINNYTKVNFHYGYADKFIFCCRHYTISHGNNQAPIEKVIHKLFTTYLIHFYLKVY